MHGLKARITPFVDVCENDILIPPQTGPVSRLSASGPSSSLTTAGATATYRTQSLFLSYYLVSLSLHSPLATRHFPVVSALRSLLAARHSPHQQLALPRLDRPSVRWANSHSLARLFAFARSLGVVTRYRRRRRSSAATDQPSSIRAAPAILEPYIRRSSGSASSLNDPIRQTRFGKPVAATVCTCLFNMIKIK